MVGRGDDLEGEHGIDAEGGNGLCKLDLHGLLVDGRHLFYERAQVVAPGGAVGRVGVGGERVHHVIRAERRAIVPARLLEGDTIGLLGLWVLVDALCQRQLRYSLPLCASTSKFTRPSKRSSSALRPQAFCSRMGFSESGSVETPTTIPFGSGFHNTRAAAIATAMTAVEAAVMSTVLFVSFIIASL